jgi:hypothetical protein
VEGEVAMNREHGTVVPPSDVERCESIPLAASADFRRQHRRLRKGRGRSRLPPAGCTVDP